MLFEQMKRGIVVDGRGSQVRVRFEDNDQMISGWLDVVQRSTAGMKVFTRPKVGSQVVCQMDANREAGVVLGAVYSDADPAPAGDEGTVHFEIGSRARGTQSANSDFDLAIQVFPVSPHHYAQMAYMDWRDRHVEDLEAALKHKVQLEWFAPEAGLAIEKSIKEEGVTVFFRQSFDSVAN